MSIYFWWLHIRKKYPENVRKVLNGKYKVIHNHEKKIKNIRKYGCPFSFFGIKFGELSPNDVLAIKRHRYMINKVKKEIKGIKEHYGI